MTRGPGRPARFLFVSCLALLAAALLCCGAPTPSRADARDPVVILLSFDGTRADEVRDLPAFGRMADGGIAAQALRPVFPTNTFPNHVSLVTGVSPARHGIVNNSFKDPERGSFRYDNDPSWLQVEPLWSLVSGAGLRSASFHWVGSEGPWRPSGRGPDEWRPFERGIAEADKIRQIIQWLREDDASRPRLITAWFRGSDGAGHRTGPDSEATRRALASQDRALATLLDVLDREGRWDTTTLLLVSDHGMAAVERRVDLAGALEEAGLRATLRGGGGFGTVTLHRGGTRERAARIASVLEVARGLGLDAWERGEGSAQRPDANPRFGDVLVMAPPGTAFARAKGIPGRLAASALEGSHGYDVDHPAMQGMVAMRGRGVPGGHALATPRAIDVAPTVLSLLGVPIPDWMEGRALLATPAP